MAASTEALSFSSLFPNRPIRPLPKRRLRERLSPEVAESIKYPPSTRTTSIFYPTYPTDIVEDEYRRQDYLCSGTNSSEDGVRRFVGRSEARISAATSEQAGSRTATVTRSTPDILNNRSASRQTPKAESGRHHPNNALPITDLSADGYESFENTNNKKKRKIPTAGDSSLGSAHSMSDGSTVPGSGLPSGHLQGDGPGSAHYNGTNAAAANSKGISGAGRGMFGRVRNGRSPLRALSTAMNWTDRNIKGRPGRQWGHSPAESPVRGIISSAIAKAGKSPTQQGQENISLLQHPTGPRTSPTSTQFTFTCESQVPGTYRGDLGPGQPPPGYMPNTSKQPLPHSVGMMNDAPDTHDVVSKGSGQTSAGQRRKSRRAVTRELDEQARQRRVKARENRRRNPVPLEEEWVCDFCIYESIFREPPIALIRAYEERERQERIAEMNKKRRLEQVKARSRKNKKQAAAAAAAASKANGNKASTSPKEHHGIPGHDPQAGGHGGVPSELDGDDDDDDGGSEEYADESFDHPDNAGHGDDLPADQHDVENGDPDRGGHSLDNGDGGKG